MCIMQKRRIETFDIKELGVAIRSLGTQLGCVNVPERKIEHRLVDSCIVDQPQKKGGAHHKGPEMRVRVTTNGQTPGKDK